MYLLKILGPQNKYTYSLTPLPSLHSLLIFLPTLPLPEPLSYGLLPLVHLSLKKQVGMMSIGSGSGRSSNNKNRPVVGNHPPACFSASQWQELEHQALVFKYMVSGIPIPPDLLRTSCPLLHNNNNTQHTHLIGSWNRFEMGRKIDTEPGRCRRTDGKKWRCSKEAYPDSKYCERHMHRGRNRSTGTSTSSRKQQQQITPSPPPNPNPNPIIKSTLPHFLSGFSSQQDINFHFLHPNYGSNMVRSGFSSTDHNDTDSSSSTLTMTLMGNSSLFPHAKHNISTPSSAMGPGHRIIKHDQQQPEKVIMHHFLDERSAMDEQGSVSDRTTQLSISIPNYLHDFFVTQKCSRSLNQW